MRLGEFAIISAKSFSPIKTRATGNRQFIGARKQVVQHLLVVREVAQHQALGERAFILKAIEETAFSDPDCCDDPSIEVDEKPLANTAASATSRMRSRVSRPLRGDVEDDLTVPQVQLTWLNAVCEPASHAATGSISLKPLPKFSRPKPVPETSSRRRGGT